MKPRTYDMTFCVSSNCKNKCDRHYSQYEFKEDRLYSMADFNCENNKEKESNCFKEKMNDIYLRECIYNLEEKFIAGGISKEEWQKIYDKFKDKFELWDGEND